ncbi:MAG: hypothetical protein AAGB04_14110, partial [Pseudomonadota bacterium]
LALDVLRNISNALNIGDRRAAEFHDNACHKTCSLICQAIRRSSACMEWIVIQNQLAHRPVSLVRRTRQPS